MIFSKPSVYLSMPWNSLELQVLIGSVLGFLAAVTRSLKRSFNGRTMGISREYHGNSMGKWGLDGVSNNY